MTDERDELNDPASGQPEPPEDPQMPAAEVTPPTADPSATPSPIPTLGNEAIAEVFSDIPAPPAEAAAPVADPQRIKEPTMDFAAVAQADDPMLVHPAEFPQLSGAAAPHPAGNIDLLLDVKLPVSIELGRTILPISDILNWSQGTVVELDKLAGEPVSLLVNNKLVARGEVVVVDENFGLRITSLVSPRERIESL
jgi:flagellar motor switch protein FliN/FliY